MSYCINRTVSISSDPFDPVAKVGDDLFGRESAERFRKDAIDAKLVVDKKNASGTALILVDSKGQNVISVALGANGTLSPWTEVPRKERMDFAPPTPGELLDWVLVIERL